MSHKDNNFQDALEPDKGNSDGTPTQNIDVCKIGVRVPPFWPDEPEIWFAQIEGQFIQSGITSDSTKYSYIVSNLERQYAKEVKDIIINPPTSNKYEKLKAELIKRLSVSNENRMKQVLYEEHLGDRKPSQFLRHLKDNAGKELSDEFLKTVWISRLPQGTQMVLAGQPATTSLDVLADLADRVNDLTAASPRVAEMTFSGPGSSVISDLVKEVAELRKQMQSLTTSTARNGRSRSRTRNRDTQRQRSQSNYKKHPVCWYHHKYGEKAHSCIKPCDYRSENSMGSR